MRLFIEIGCLSLMLGFSVPALAADQDIFTSTIVQAGRGTIRNTEGDILPLKNGNLLLGWTDFYSNDSSDFGPAQLSEMTSYDGGKTWRDKRVLQRNIGNLNVMTVNLLRLHSGKVLLVFLKKDSDVECAPMVRVSTDDAKTFSPPKRIAAVPRRVYTGTENARTIQLRSGRILLPVYYAPDIGENYCDRCLHLLTRVYYSDDEGQTWQASRTVVDVKESSWGADEPGIVELKDGRVMMWIRTSVGHPYQSYSSDKGETWTTPQPMTVRSPSAPQSIGKIPSTGDLLMIWNDSPAERVPLTSAISKDNGRTWGKEKVLESAPGHGYAYTSMEFIGDKVYLTYWRTEGYRDLRGSADGMSIVEKIVPVSWFYK